MDELDRRIAATRERLMHLESELAALKAKRDEAALSLGIFEEAARLRPSGDARASLGGALLAPEERKGGRKPGAISQNWKRVLVSMAREDDGGGITQDRTVVIAREIMPTATDHSIRDRLRRYRDKLKLVESVGDRFRVKKDVAEKFSAEIARSIPGTGEDPASAEQQSVEDLI